jgi:hypothetical protein
MRDKSDLPEHHHRNEKKLLLLLLSSIGVTVLKKTKDGEIQYQCQVPAPSDGNIDVQVQLMWREIAKNYTLFLCL